MQGLLGLELALRHKPDLILLDIHLPDIGGAEVLARLRAEELTRDIPVVVLSADATKSQIDRLLAAGAHDYLTKPLDVDHFLKVIEGNLREATSVSSNGNGA
jgi:CheY-like chemotaxis protein